MGLSYGTRTEELLRVTAAETLFSPAGLKVVLKGFWPRLVYTVLVAASFCVVVVLLMVLPLDAGSIHGDGGHQTSGLVTAAAQARLETIFKLLAHKIESDWVYA